MRREVLTIATWNVNSIRMRLPLLLAWLKEEQPDIVLLQETKIIDDQFPRDEIETLYYNIAVHGQKTYNGVAILSKFPLEDVTCGFPGSDPTQARYIEAVTGGVRVASVYVPNGTELGSPSYMNKLNFFKSLTDHTRMVLAYEEAFILGGDFNVAPTSEDVYDPRAWHEQLLCTTPEREAYRALVYLGLTDALRACHPDQRDLYTWWDYRRAAWQNNLGLRIDHLLLSPQAADRLQGAEVLKSLRGLEKPSDHTPVQVQLAVV